MQSEIFNVEQEIELIKADLQALENPPKPQLQPQQMDTDDLK